MLAQRLGGLADLTFAGKEHQDVAAAIQAQLVDGVDDRLLHRLILLSGAGLLRRSVTYPRRGRCDPTPDHRRIAEVGENRPGLMVAEVMINRKSGRLASSRCTYPEQKIDVEAAFVCLVDDQGASYSVRSRSRRISASRMPSVISLTCVRRRRDHGTGPCSRRSAPPPDRARWPHAPDTVAAMRRGWVWPIRPNTPRPRLRQIFGSWVDFRGAGLAAQYDDLIVADQCTDPSTRSLIGNSVGNDGRGNDAPRRAATELDCWICCSSSRRSALSAGATATALGFACRRRRSRSRQFSMVSCQARQDSSLPEKGNHPTTTLRSMNSPSLHVRSALNGRRGARRRSAVRDRPVPTTARTTWPLRPDPRHANAEFIYQSELVLCLCLPHLGRTPVLSAGPAPRTGTLTPLRWMPTETGSPRHRPARRAPCQARVRPRNRPLARPALRHPGCAGTGAGQLSHGLKNGKALIFTSFHAGSKFRAALKNSSVAPLYRLAKRDFASVCPGSGGSQR